MNNLKHCIGLSLLVLSIFSIITTGVSAAPPPPEGVTNLTNITFEQNYINWTWTDPVHQQFSKVMIYINGDYMTDVLKGVQYYNATDLPIPDTEYTIGTRTVRTSGNKDYISQTWVNHTARTAPVPDTAPPTTTINITGDARTGEWYASHVQVELNATDDRSGVAKTEYSLDNNNWTIYTAPFSITNEGDTVIYYRSTDNAGNIEPPKGELIRIDTIPPQIIIDGIIEGGYYNMNVTSIITIIEPNIVSRSTTLNGMPYEGSTISEEGSYMLVVSAADIVDHSSVKSVNFTIDRTPPSSITNLNNATFEQSYINWTWTDPEDLDFSYVIIYLDGVFQTNISKGAQLYNAAGLDADTQYTISTHTVDTTGNINQTWVNHTARTSPATPPDSCISSCWTVNYIIY